MGKGKDKKDKGKGKKGDARKGGGVRIPKPLRKAGKEALKLASEPVVSEIVAAALLSAAAALRGEKGAGAAADAAGEAGRKASKMGDSMRALAIDLARRTLDNWERPASEKGGSGKAKKGGKGGG